MTRDLPNFIRSKLSSRLLVRYFQAFTAGIAAVIVCGVVAHHKLVPLIQVDAEVTERMNWVYTGRL
jgi:hypothetical protein